MKYVSLDLETTALEPGNGSILSIAMIVVDTEVVTKDTPLKELPSLHLLIGDANLFGEAYALNMNSKLIESIVKEGEGFNGEYVFWEDVEDRIKSFLIEHFDELKGINILGKNVGFDLEWLHSEFPNMSKWWHYTPLEVGSMVFNPIIHEKNPSLRACLEMFGLVNPHPHCALHDAYYAAMVERHKNSTTNN